MSSTRVARVRLEELAPMNEAIAIEEAIAHNGRAAAAMEASTAKLEEIISVDAQGTDRIKSASR